MNGVGALLVESICARIDAIESTLKQARPYMAMACPICDSMMARERDGSSYCIQCVKRPESYVHGLSPRGWEK